MWFHFTSMCEVFEGDSVNVSVEADSLEEAMEAVCFLYPDNDFIESTPATNGILDSNPCVDLSCLNR